MGSRLAHVVRVSSDIRKQTDRQIDNRNINEEKEYFSGGWAYGALVAF